MQCAAQAPANPFAAIVASRYNLGGGIRMNKAYWVVGIMVLATAGCGRPSDEPVVITETREAGAPPDNAATVTSRERFGLSTRTPSPSPMMGSAAAAGGDAAAPAAGWTWSPPPGWTQGPDRSMRVVTFTAGSGDTVECYVTELSGTAGGVEANFNRWRAQLGLPPWSSAEIDALPRIRLLEESAPLLDATGTFTGMGETEKANHRMLGTMVVRDGRAIFVKMIGPAAEVDTHRDAFAAFCASLRAE